MSIDFTVTFAGPDQSLDGFLIRFENAIAPTGYERSTALVRVELDVARGVVDETDEELRVDGSMSSVGEALASWQGVAVELLHQEAGSFYLIVARTEGQFFNAWVDVPERSLRRLCRQRLVATFYAALNAVALGCEARGGLGDLERAFEPISPDALEQDISKARMGSPEDATQLYILPGAALLVGDDHKQWSKQSKISRFVGGYVVVETEAFCDFWYMVP